MIHLTEKPVALAARAIKYSSCPGVNVLDLFERSESTLIAADQTGRRSLLMGLGPLYCDVSVERFEKFTGQQAKRLRRTIAVKFTSDRVNSTSAARRKKCLMLNRVVETCRGPVECSEAGIGDPILYFHGTGVTGDAMLSVESRLIEDGFRLIIPNRPGYGKTPLAPHRTAAACADLMATLLDSLGITRISVMGSSGGAAFAGVFAAIYPGRTTSLTMLCPQVHRWDHKRWLPATSRWTLPLLKRRVLRKLLLKLYGMQLRRTSIIQFLKMEAGGRYTEVADDPVAQALCEMTLAALGQSGGCAGFENDFVVFTSEEILGGGRSIRTPVLVIHDEADPISPADHVAWFVSRCPQCETVSIHAAGHLVWVGPDADYMHRVRVRFLKRHVATAGLR